ncbi:hypothetical protein G9A89_012625 [Geosiphon pyriformis]|nr:hypothetical protein G9A89_012625 [Geosiphon pyriformis]
MVHVRYLSKLELVTRVFIITLLIAIVVTCVTQNAIRKVNGAPLLKFTTLDSTITIAPTLQFCLQNLNLQGIGRLKMDSFLGAPGQNISSLNQYITYYWDENENEMCAVFRGDQYPAYRSDQAPSFGFSLVSTTTNNLYTYSNAIIEVTCFEAGESVIQHNITSNIFQVPFGYQYVLQYVESRTFEIGASTSIRQFTFDPFLPLGQANENSTIFYFRQRGTDVDQRMEQTSFTFWDFVTGLSGLISFLMVVYVMLFGNFRIDPWGAATRFILYRQQSKFYKKTSKEENQVEIPFLNINEDTHGTEYKTIEQEVKALRERLMALENVLSNYVIKTDVVNTMYNV